MSDHYTKAVWNAAENAPSFPPLENDLEVDAVVVGAGITGLSAACNLSKAGKSVAVLEAFGVGTGTTGSSTGNLYAAIDERLYSIGKKHSEEVMRETAASRMAAIDYIEQRTSEYAIPCDFQRTKWHLFTTPDTSVMKEQVENELKAAREAGLSVSASVPDNFPFEADAIVSVANQAQYNPLAYAQGLAAGIAGDNCRIFENTRVIDVKDDSPCRVYTDRGTVRATKVVMATHSPKGVYAVHTAMEPYREYALAARLKGELPEQAIYWHVTPEGQYSVRPYQRGGEGYLLVLGRPHKVGHKERNEEEFTKLEQYLRRHFDIAGIAYRWAAQNYKPADNLPYIGVSPLQKNVYIATGFAADGLVYGTLAAMLIADHIGGRTNKWARLYDPRRFTPVASAQKFLKENMSVAGSLIKDYLFYDKAYNLDELKPGEAKVISIGGDKLAAYREETGHVHLVSAICPHMGCVVHWNNAEKTWDCPCHGSRFSMDGETLEGPAYKNLAKPEKAPPETQS